jgi:hypothetical protein
MLWLGALILFIALQPGILFAFPPIKNGIVTITTIVIHALIFGVIVACFNQTKVSIEGYQGTDSICNNIDLETNGGELFKNLCNSDLPEDPNQTLLTDSNFLLGGPNVAGGPNNLYNLPKDDPYFNRYSKIWNFFHAEDIVKKQPKIEGFSLASAIGSSIKGGGAMRAFGFGAMGAMGFIACFQNNVMCGVSNIFYSTDKDCSIEAQYKQSDSPPEFNSGTNMPLRIS